MTKPIFRHKSRRFALQALYQWVISGNKLSAIEAQMLVSEPMQKAKRETDIAYFNELVHQVPKHLDTLDEEISSYIDRPIGELDIIELILMRIGTYELMYRLEVPYKVTIDEAIDLAKTFGGQDGHRYVNGVLDKLAKKHRANEL